MPHPPELPSPVRQQFEALGPPQPMRRGSLSERFMTCSKPGCACATTPPPATSGPQPHPRCRGADPVAVGVRGASPRGRTTGCGGPGLPAHIDAYWRACEAWADAELGGTTTAAGAAKGGLSATLAAEFTTEIATRSARGGRGHRLRGRGDRRPPCRVAAGRPGRRTAPQRRRHGPRRADRAVRVRSRRGLRRRRRDLHDGVGTDAAGPSVSLLRDLPPGCRSAG